MLTGKELKVKRIILEVAANDIAKYLGISKTYISLMENSKRRIPEDTYVKWVNYLNR